VLRRGGQGLMDRQRLVEQRERLLRTCDRQLLLRDRPLAGRRTQPVDAEPPRQLRKPGPDGRVVPELVEVLVGAREHLLEDVLRVLRREPEGLDGDGVDVAGEALDKLPPSIVVAFTAAGDEGGVGQLGGQR